MTADAGLDLGRVFLGIMRRSIFSTTLPGITLVLVPPSMRPMFRYGCLMPATFGRDLLVLHVLGVQRIHDGRGALQRVDPGVRHGGVGHLAVHRDFHLQAAVV